jgi:hypothetical protein
MITSYDAIYVLIVTKLKMEVISKLSVEHVINNVYFMIWHIYVFVYLKIKGGAFLIYWDKFVMKIFFHVFIYIKNRVKVELILLIVG